jgi:putative holliday junction resolvase
MILGIDPGRRRVGVAVADWVTRFARPLEVIDRSRTEPVARITELVRSLGVTSVVVGRPVGLSGEPGPALHDQQALVESLRSSVDVEVCEFDERFTTVVAERALVASGASARVRRSRRDAVAAQVMLQGYLDSTR